VSREALGWKKGAVGYNEVQHIWVQTEPGARDGGSQDSEIRGEE